MPKLFECPKCETRFSPDEVKHIFCNVCRQWKEPSSFYRNNHICKVCSFGYKGGPYRKGQKQEETNRPHGCTQRRRITEDGELLKRCSKCKQWKRESEFAKYHKSADGLQGWCSDCNNTFRQKQRHPDLMENGK